MPPNNQGGGGGRRGNEVMRMRTHQSHAEGWTAAVALLLAISRPPNPLIQDQNVLIVD